MCTITCPDAVYTMNPVIPGFDDVSSPFALRLSIEINFQKPINFRCVGVRFGKSGTRSQVRLD